MVMIFSITYCKKEVLHYTVKPSFNKLFKKRKNVYYCMVFTIYQHVIYAVIASFGKQQKVY